jgi:hypothetical protein
VGQPIDIESLCERAWDFCEEDRLLPLQGSTWYTGFSSDGKQMLIVYDEANVRVFWFDAGGHLLNTEAVPHNLAAEAVGAYFQRDDYPDLESFLHRRFGYQDGTIHVRRFQDCESGVAIKPLPYWLEDFLLDPERTPEQYRQKFAGYVQEWLEMRDTYVLEAWGNTFFIDIHDGHCTAS